MNENRPPRVAGSLASLTLPCLSLALTLVAFSLGAPVKLARLVRSPTPILAGLELDATIRYEPVVSAELGGFNLVGAKRVLDGLVNEQLFAVK